jgi:hypothetical protein
MQPTAIQVRLYAPDDYAGLIAVFEDCYAGIDDNFASMDDMEDLRLSYPDGQIVACIGDEVVGVILSLHCKYAQFSQPQKMTDIYNPAQFASYGEGADSLFALEILVKSTHQRKGIGKLLNERLTETLVRNNLRAFIGVSRVSGYGALQAHMTIDAYLQKVVAGELNDPSLSYNCSNGMLPKMAVADYYPPDLASAGYGALVIQQNPHYQMATAPAVL